MPSEPFFTGEIIELNGGEKPIPKIKSQQPYKAVSQLQCEYDRRFLK